MSIDDFDEIRNLSWEEVSEREFEETPEQIIARNIRRDQQRKEITEGQKQKNKKYAHRDLRELQEDIPVIPFDPTNPEAMTKGNYVSVSTKTNGKDKISVGRIINVEPERIQVDFDQRPESIVSQPLSGRNNYLSITKYKPQ